MSKHAAGPALGTVLDFRRPATGTDTAAALVLRVRELEAQLYCAHRVEHALAEALVFAKRERAGEYVLAPLAEAHRRAGDQVYRLVRKLGAAEEDASAAGAVL